MRFSVIEISLPDLPPAIEGAEGSIVWGQTYASADTMDEAIVEHDRLKNAEQGAEPLQLAIYDNQDKQLFVYSDEA